MVEVYLHNTGEISDEFEAAKNLKYLLENNLDDCDGKIWLIPSVDVHPATGYHDLDLVMLGYLQDYYIDITDKKDIDIKSFCTTIELKTHNAEGMYRNGTHLIVKYPNEDHDVTKQSNGQKISLQKFLQESLQYGKRVPFVTNLIWLVGTDYDDFENTVGLTNSNILTSDVTINEIFDAIGRQVQLVDQGYVDAFKDYSYSEIEKVADIFCAKSDGVDTMSLRRMNILKEPYKVPFDIDQMQDPVIIISGHAGTGKTLMLLQAADLLTKKGKKCIFLTYNNALITDLKHTMKFMSKQMANFEMKSMHSFLISILYKKGLWNNSKDIENDFMPAIASLSRSVGDYSVDYQYVFVDEAQDWEKPVADVLKKICRKSHIVIADGVDQFMRSDYHTDWGISQFPKMKKCLRQRRNLTVFAKLFAQKMGVSWNVDPNNDFYGGRVIVITNGYEPEKHFKLLEQAKEHGCKEYDMMYLVPPSMTENGQFSLKSKYEDKGIHIYDGVNRKTRDTEYGDQNKLRKECRLYTYESCRGLEAWTTVCHRFHELFEAAHPHDYSEIPYEPARRYMLTLWTLIPLTRAIDTLVLVVKIDSKISSLLKELHDENPDIIEFNTL